MRRQARFTLLELLVVLTVLAVLATLILPLLGKAREKSLRMQCAGNQRFCVAALQAYAADHNGSFPPARCSAPRRPAILSQDADLVAAFADNYLQGQYELLEEPLWAGHLRQQLDDWRAGNLPPRPGARQVGVDTYGYLGAAVGQDWRWDHEPRRTFDPDWLGLDPEAIARRSTANPEWPLIADVACQALSLAGDIDRVNPPNWWLVAPHLAGGGSYRTSCPTDRADRGLGELVGGNVARVDGRVEWQKASHMVPVLLAAPERLYYWPAVRQ